MSCVREASPPLTDDHLRHADMKKRRFLQPFRGLRRIFRKKERPSVISASLDENAGINRFHASNENLEPNKQIINSNLESAKSHSTSHLDDNQADNVHRSSLQSTTLLSVSHDSVFTSEQRSPDSGSETSLYIARTTTLGFPHSSVRAELFEAVHNRRRAQQDNTSDDDEDLGLPRSPICNSPTITDDIFTKENNVTKWSQSTYSDGSLLSMESSEMDEESYCHNSRNSSKLSLYEKQTPILPDLEHNDQSTNSSNDNEAVSLSHSAAKHKMAVKPKRNHGAPHKKRQFITSSGNSLPATPELNEESNIKNCAVMNLSSTRDAAIITSRVDASTKSVADSEHSDEHPYNQNHACKLPLSPEHHKSNHFLDKSSSLMKYCSLPPVVSLNPTPSFKLLTRSKSDVSSLPPPLPNVNLAVYDVLIDEKESSKKEDGTSFFSRLLRRSNKKKDSTEEFDSLHAFHDTTPSATLNYPFIPDEQTSLPSLKEDPIWMAYVNGGLSTAMKHHPLFRQRIEPLDLLGQRENPNTCTMVSYSCTVPVNISDINPPSSISVNTNSSGNQQQNEVQNSYGFCNSDQLLSSTNEDLRNPPLKISLAEENLVILNSPSTVITVAEDSFSKTYLPSNNEDTLKEEKEELKNENTSTNLMSICELTNTRTSIVEAILCTSYSRRILSATESIHDYENIPAVNKLSISVNENMDAHVLMTKDATAGKPIVTQMSPDSKIPVPAPRTSLVNRSPSQSQLTGRNYSSSSSSSSSSSNCSLLNNDNINVTIMESADGQKSVISIGSNAYCVTATELLETDAMDMVNHSSELGFENVANRMYELEDDVFHPSTEVMEKVDNSTKLSSSSVINEIPYVSKIDELADQVNTIKNSNNELNATDILENVVEMTTTKLEEEKREPNLMLKPIAKADFNAGVVKTNDITVIMRKKEAQSKKDDEPELMKVFARRSLKLKETDNMTEIIYDGASKSRDSDKENEDLNIIDEQLHRKKSEAPNTVIAAVLPKSTAFGRFQRSINHDTEKNVLVNGQPNHMNDKRQRCKSTSMITNEVEKRNRIPSLSVEQKSIRPTFTSSNIEAPCDEKSVMPFKRIQQRREEWEKRVQQAMKVHGTK